MSFAEIIWQATKFAVIFFVFSRFFNRFVFKNRNRSEPSLWSVLVMTGVFVGTTYFMEFVNEKYFNKTSTPIVQIVEEQLPKPLNTSLNFAHTTHPCQLTVVKTDLAEYTFSNHGATIDSIELFWHDGKKVKLLPSGTRHFIVAFDHESPLQYELVSNVHTDGGTHEILYQAKYKHNILQKKFVLYDKTYQIDVQVSVTDLHADQTLRLVLPTPANTDQLHAIVSTKQNAKRLKLQDIALNKPSNFSQSWNNPQAFGFASHYFTHLCFATTAFSLDRAYLVQDDEQTFAVLQTKPGLEGQVEFGWSLYAGSNCASALHDVAPQLTSLADYGFLGFLARPMAWLLVSIKDYVHSYGWAIILVTILIKLLLIPFTLRGERGLKDQAEFEKKRQYLQQKYKHDKEALNQALGELIAKQGLPIFSGCLPLLLNIPVFLALNKVLTGCAELYAAPFLWLPDLSASDPYYIVAVLTFFGMILTPSIQTGPRQWFSKVGFALFLAAVTSYLASGLALFIVINAWFGVVQNWVMAHFKKLKA
jgi:YidC/Oxa1 family membrane protein insertase